MDIQFSVLALLFGGIVVHVMLHWTWVCGVIGSRLWKMRDGSKRTMDDGQRTIAGVGFLIVLLNIMGLAIAVAMLSVKAPY